jgi:hypothetical protein
MKTKLFYLVILCIALTSCNSKPKNINRITPVPPPAMIKYSKFNILELIEISGFSENTFHKEVLSRGYVLNDVSEKIDSNYLLVSKEYIVKSKVIEHPTIVYQVNTAEYTKRLRENYNLSSIYTKSKTFRFTENITNRFDELEPELLKAVGFKKLKNRLYTENPALKPYLPPSFCIKENVVVEKTILFEGDINNDGVSTELYSIHITVFFR